MNNLKRVLSLALTGAMLSGLMVMGAGAVDFVDAEDIQHTEAVETISALNIINGKPVGDGKVEFDPDATIRRDEMAKIVAYIMNGGKEPVYSTSNYTFTDVPATQWAQKYIYYCAANEIINGDGAGHFMPDQNVTASQAAKMILTVLGYNSDVFGLTGLDWESNTNSVANRPENDLYEKFYADYGANFNPSQPATRDMIALMVYNALDANIMTMSYNVDSQGNNQGHTLTLEKNKTLLSEKFGAIEVTGVVVGNEYADLGATEPPAADTPSGAAEGDDAAVAAKLADGKTKIQYTGDSVGLFGGTTLGTFNVSSGKDELGRSVTFFIKKGATAGKSTVVGALAVSDSNNVIVDTAGTKYAKILSDNDLTNGYTDNAYTDYVKGTAPAAQAPAVGDEVIYIDNNGDDTVDYLFTNKTYLAEVTDKTINEKKDKDSTITLDSKDINAGETNADEVTVKKSSVVGFDDVDEDDIVLVNKAGTRYYVTKADTLEGKIARYKGSAKAYTQVTIDGTKYTLSQAAVPSTNIVDSVAGLTAIDDKVSTFYLDANGYIIARGEVKETVKNYAFVVGLSTAGSNNIDGNRVRVATTDGSVKTYDLKDGLSTEDKEKFGIGAVITYELDGSTLKAKSVVTAGPKSLADPDNDSNVLEADAFTKGKTKVVIPGTNSGNPIYATSTTVFFHVTLKQEISSDGQNTTTYLPDEVNVYTGYANAPSIGAGIAFKKDSTEIKNYGVAAFDADTGKASVVVLVGELAGGKTSAKDYLFLDSFGTTTADNKLTEANVILPGEKETTTVDVASIDGQGWDKIVKDDVDKALYTFKLDKDDNYVLTPASDNVVEDGEIKNVDGLNVSVSVTGDSGTTVTEYTLAKDGVVIDATGDTTKIAVGEAKVKTDNVVTFLTDGDQDAPSILMMVITAASK